VVCDGVDGWYVSDAADNAVLHVDRAGRIRTVTVVASMAPFGGRPRQEVPTGLVAPPTRTLWRCSVEGGPTVVVVLRPSPGGDPLRAAARAVAPITVASNT
jgi:hypothetical protein